MGSSGTSASALSAFDVSQEDQVQSCGKQVPVGVDLEHPHDLLSVALYWTPNVPPAWVLEGMGEMPTVKLEASSPWAPLHFERGPKQEHEATQEQASWAMR